MGGEAQFYVDDLTLYLQAGYLDAEESAAPGSDDRFDPFRDALFVRSVARWFMTPDSRLQGQVSYADGVQEDDRFDMTIVE